MNIEKSCFVIMPFGEKTDAKGKPINFDLVYEKLIKGALEGEDTVAPGYTVECVRCDEIDRGGWIHRKMIQHIHESDLAVVDMTTLNPNVFYELGVRHALVPAGTLLMRRAGTFLPFNITGFNTIEYPNVPLTTRAKASLEQIEDFLEKLRVFAANAITVGGVDSLVHETIKVEIRTKSPPIRKSEEHVRQVKGQQKSVGLMTGDLVHVRGIDAWVNSENTNMQMDRNAGGSISSVIRYYGAQKDAADHVVDDVIAKELGRIMDGRTAVNPGAVLVTGAGGLTERNGVKRIFHAASVVGQVRVGFRPIHDLSVCVDNVLQKAGADPEIRSILFPLMGTGTARGELEAGTRALIGAAISYFQNYPDSTLEKILFLAWSKAERKVCEQILDQDDRLAPRVKPKSEKKPPAKKKTTRKKTTKKKGRR